MTMISRDWRCENRACHAVFHSFEPHPVCPSCGCVRVNWVPGGGHVGRQYKQLDASLNALAKNYGMSDINSPSPSRLDRAMPKHERPVGDSPFLWNFAPGFVAPFNMQSQPTCEPSRQPVNFKVTAATGREFQPNTRYAPIGAGTPAARAAIARGGKKPATS